MTNEPLIDLEPLPIDDSSPENEPLKNARAIAARQADFDQVCESLPDLRLNLLTNKKNNQRKHIS